MLLFSMKFREMLTHCIECNREIPHIDQSYSRKYCRECSKLSIKKAQREHLIRTGRITLKPCFVCGKMTYRHKTCSSECVRRARIIEKMIESIARKKAMIVKQEKELFELRKRHD